MWLALALAVATAGPLAVRVEAPARVWIDGEPMAYLEDLFTVRTDTLGAGDHLIEIRSLDGVLVAERIVRIGGDEPIALSFAGGVLLPPVDPSEEERPVATRGKYRPGGTPFPRWPLLSDVQLVDIERRAGWESFEDGRLESMLAQLNGYALSARQLASLMALFPSSDGRMGLAIGARLQVLDPEHVELLEEALGDPLLQSSLRRAYTEHARKRALQDVSLTEPSDLADPKQSFKFTTPL